MDHSIQWIMIFIFNCVLFIFNSTAVHWHCLQHKWSFVFANNTPLGGRGVSEIIWIVLPCFPTYLIMVSFMIIMCCQKHQLWILTFIINFHSNNVKTFDWIKLLFVSRFANLPSPTYIPFSPTYTNRGKGRFNLILKCNGTSIKFIPPFFLPSWTNKYLFRHFP